MHVKWMYGESKETNFRTEEVTDNLYTLWNLQVMFLCLMFSLI
jgi:hypothetical protein